MLIVSFGAASSRCEIAVDEGQVSTCDLPCELLLEPREKIIIKFNRNHPRTRRPGLPRQARCGVDRTGRAHHQHQVALLGCVLRCFECGPGQGLAKPHHAGPHQVAAAVAMGRVPGHGMVEVDEPGQFWHIGPGAFRVGSAFLRRTKVVERARGPMDQLMRDSGETANLGVEVGDQVLFLSQVETHQAIRAFFPPGTMAPMHVSGIGKALLAWYPEEKVKGILARKGLERFTTLTHTTETALLRDLARARSRAGSRARLARGAAVGDASGGAARVARVTEAVGTVTLLVTAATVPAT